MSRNSSQADAGPRGQIRILIFITAAWLLVIGGLWLAMGSLEERLNFGVFVGRFHILIVHMPIGLLAGALALEAASILPVFRRWGEGVVPMLWLSLLGGIAATLLGYVLMQADDFTGKFVTLHMWTGLGVVLLTAVSLYFCLFNAGRKINLLMLAATCGLTSAAGHFGGNMVHGEDYLTEYAPFLGGSKDAAEVKELAFEDRPIYHYIIQPVFEEKCIDCHNEGKVKGDLRMDSYEWLAKGGDYGPPFEPGDAEASEIYYRVTTDPEEDDFMPPEGKADPLTEDEIHLLAWWINLGGAPTMTIGQANPDEETLSKLKAFFGAAEPDKVAVVMASHRRIHR